MKDFVRPDALKEEFAKKEVVVVGASKTDPKKLPVVKVVETDIYPVNHYFG